MNLGSMSRWAAVAGTLCIVLALIILVFADGLRRWYSGGFFLVMGVVAWMNAVRWSRTHGQT